jgi:hypothetical protein
VVVYGEIKKIPRASKWYYVACKKCNHKVIPDEIFYFGDVVPCPEREKTVYKCKSLKCKGDIIEVVPRYYF